MDEEEIEAWYDEQKEKLTDEYRKKIDKTKNPEALKKPYLKAMGKLHKKYESLSNKNTKGNLRKHFFNHRIAMLKQKLLKPFKELQERRNARKKQKPES